MAEGLELGSARAEEHEAPRCARQTLQQPSRVASVCLRHERTQKVPGHPGCLRIEANKQPDDHQVKMAPPKYPRQEQI